MTTIDSDPPTRPADGIEPTASAPGSTTPAPGGTAAPSTAEAVAERLLAATLGAFDLFSIYLGDKLGWYRSLVDDGPATAAELAARTGTQERYAHEWLEQQAATGLLHVDDPASGRMRIDPATAEALIDENSLNLFGPISGFIAAVGRNLDQLLRAYRSGGGVSWAELGDDARETQAALNRPLFDLRLADALRSVPDLDRSLSAPGARIADVGCGYGWSTIALSKAYPQASVIGYDVDEPSIATARQNAAHAGLDDRVSFRVADGAGLGDDHGAAGRFTAAFAFECLHDLPQPVPMLAAMRTVTEPDGQVVIMDEAVADRFSAPADDVDRLMYGYSVLICLPDSLSTPDSAATGTVMRKPVLESYAEQAGFSGVEVLPIEEFGFFRFYRLQH